MSYKLCLYILTFNNPNQLKLLLDSLESYQDLSRITKYCIDNSTNIDDIEENITVCKQKNVFHINTPRNLGCTGGRQYAANHFETQNNFDYYLYFEDDMLLINDLCLRCHCGFGCSLNGTFFDLIDIMKKHNLDFLKLSFSEVIYNNHNQCSWLCMDQNQKNTYFPNIQILPDTKFTNILTHKNIPYALGEIYYCNWPGIFSKRGNKEIFKTIWSHEIHIMAHTHILIMKNQIRSGILLLSLIKHDRRHFYENRIESDYQLSDKSQ